MPSFKSVLLFLSLLACAIILLSSPAFCKNDDEEKLLQGINNFRTAQKLPILKENDNAECLADKVADKLEDKSCSAAATLSTGQIKNYPEQVKKCKIDLNSSAEAVVLPACVPHLASTSVLGNFTQSSKYARYINSSRYTGIGIGSEDDWIVVVLATDAPTGSVVKGGASGSGLHRLASLALLLAAIAFSLFSF